MEITYKGRTEGVELKITAASAGSLVLKYVESARPGQKWQFNDVSNDPEKEFLVGVAEESGALKKINREWSDVPLKRDVKDPVVKAKIKSMDPKKRYEMDGKNFPEISEAISASYISDYYSHKKTHYVNIGTSGFYIFDNTDPFGLNSNLRKHNMPLVPSFAKSAKAKYRARVQYKGSGNYQFTFEMSFSVPNFAKSKYNIAPIDGKSVNILTKAASIDCFLV